MSRFFLIFAFIAIQAFISLAFADTAAFNTQDSTLSLSSVRVTDGTAFQNVVVRLTSFGTVTVNDPRVGNNVEFNLSSNTLFLPLVTVDNVPYSQVSLSGLAFVVLRVNGISVDNNGSSGSFALNLAITASGIETPAIRIGNVPKPNTRNEFCSDDIYKQFQQSVQGFSGSWQITSCSFDGTTGLVGASLIITSPYSMSLPYSVRYTYVAQ